MQVAIPFLNGILTGVDGDIVTYAGDPAFVTHTYTGEGLTFNISVAATDEDGNLYSKTNYWWQVLIQNSIFPL